MISSINVLYITGICILICFGFGCYQLYLANKLRHNQYTIKIEGTQQYDGWWKAENSSKILLINAIIGLCIALLGSLLFLMRLGIIVLPSN
jgi:hypothetical protein